MASTARSLRKQHGTTRGRGEGGKSAERVFRSIVPTIGVLLGLYQTLDVRRGMPMISLADQKRRIEKGELTPDAALKESLSAIDAQEKAIGAFAFRAKAPRAQTEG